MDSAKNIQNLIIKTLTGSIYTINSITDDKLVLDLKVLINVVSESQHPVDKQRLVYKGRPMANSDKLSEYNLADGCTVHLVTSSPQTSSSLSKPLELTEEQLKFDRVLRQKLSPHLSQETTDKLMLKLHQDFQKDLKIASLDDIDRLAIQKLETNMMQPHSQYMV